MLHHFTKKMPYSLSAIIIFCAQYATNSFAQNMQSNLPSTQIQQPQSGFGKQVSNTKNTNTNGTLPQLVAPINIPKKVQKAVTDLENSHLNKKQIQTIKEINLQTNEAAMMPYNNTAKPVIRTLMLDLSPGVSAPVLRLSNGQLTSLVFSSSNGDPWYVESVKLNRNIFSDGLAPNTNINDSPTNVLTVEPLKALAYGNVTIMLKGLNTPVIFALTTGQKEVDFRVDIKVPGRNPDNVSRVNYADKIPNLDENISYFLDGIPPKSAKKLKVHGANIEAWSFNDNLYIRTNADVQYPAYYSSAKSTSGVAVYRFNQIYNTLSLLQNGVLQTVSIEQY